MIEGQEGVTWEDWQALAWACEEYGVGTMYRSDHYLSVVEGSGRGALDAWTTITALSAVTTRLRLGTMVSPVTFRHPSVLSKLVVTADHVSAGRVELGIGAGWWEREHAAYGIPLPPMNTRMKVLEEQLELIARQWADDVFSFTGDHYAVVDLDAQPKPIQKPRPPLILGGTGKPRGLRLAARLADEYNLVEASPSRAAAVRLDLDRACEAADRDPATLPLSLMTGWIVGADEIDLRARAERLAQFEGSANGKDYLAAVPESWIQGTVAVALEWLAELEQAGVSRVMAQHLLHRDLEAIELLGREVLAR